MFPRLFLIILCCFSILSCKREKYSYTDTLAINTSPEPSKMYPTANLDAVKKWIYAMQHTSGLIESAEDTNFVSLYDNALAILFFIQEDEKAKAEKILNFYHSKINEEVLLNGGLYQTRTTHGEEAQTLWMGDNAWLLIAINHYKNAYGPSKYDTLGNHLEKWLRSLQDPDGGLTGGIRANGAKMPKITEGIITAFNAVEGYDDFHKNILKFLKNERWDTENKILMAWPENPKYAYALDVQSLSSSIFPEMAENVIIEADRYLNEQEMILTGTKIKGYGFDEDKDVVWLEGTAQMAVAFNEINRPDLAQNLIMELEKSLLSSSSVPWAKGLPYATNQGTTYGSEELWDHAHTKPALSSSIWYVFAATNFNPLALGSIKKIPKADKFWARPLLN